MASYKAPLREMRFVLHDVFGAEKIWSTLPGMEDMSSDLADAVLEEAARMVEGEWFPLYRSADEEGCSWEEGVVKTPKGFKEAFATFSANGWSAFSGNPQFGGQGMPKMLAVLFEEMMHSGNTSLALYPLLSNGATLALDAHASDELKQRYLPKMYSGEWAGTMCLTEPHCGTDLGIMRTKAEPQEDGSYRITGTKIFITGGEHDLNDNIVHLVLAKLPGAPEGSKGISLFLVPKRLVDAEGHCGELNGVSCGSIEHKMGIKGSATCVMNFDNAQGWLIGEENAGLACMFTMMNYERLSIGLQGVGLGEVSYQSAVEYARERLQGRSDQGVVNAQGNADPIIVHGDVRRMLLTMRAWNEAGRALAVYLGMQLDISKFSQDRAEAKAAADRVALLTPVAKAFFSDRGLETCVQGQQVYGGHGYIREWGMEQLVRDCRIAQIYEGTNGIQALDLAGRKVVRNKGESVASLLAEIRQWISEQPDNAQLSSCEQALEDALGLLEGITEELMAQAQEDSNAINSAAVEYLELSGLVVYAWMWSKLMRAALEVEDPVFRDAKVTTGKFFFSRLLPKAQALANAICSGSEHIMELQAEAF